VPASYLVAPLWAAADTTATSRLDRTTANALLASAGYQRGNFGIAERGSDRLIVTLIVPANAPALAEAARGVAVDLAVLGIAVQVSERPPAEVRQRVVRGDFDLAVLDETADDPISATDRYSGAVSPWFDVIASAARAAPDRSEARPLYGELQRLWSDALPALPLYQVLKVDVVPARLEGTRPCAHGAPLTWNVGEWRFATR
jgi:ABC-type transport system substrate-binding protein